MSGDQGPAPTAATPSEPGATALLIDGAARTPATNATSEAVDHPPDDAGRRQLVLSVEVRGGASAVTPPRDGAEPAPGAPREVAVVDPELERLLSRQEPSLVRELLVDASAVGARLLRPDVRAQTVSAVAAWLVFTAAVAGVALSSLTGSDPLRAAVLTPATLVVALLATLGPVAASAVLVGARVSWAMLTATLTAALAAAGFVLLALVPVSVALWRVDDAWAGPLTLVGSLGVAGFIAGRRARALLESLAAAAARQAGRPLSASGTFRVGVVARVALVQLAFTLSVALWALRPLG